MYSCNTMGYHFRYVDDLFKVIIATLKKVSDLENLSTNIQNTTTNNYNGLLNKLHQRNFYSPQGRPPYLAPMIRYALHLSYTSLQVYRLLLGKLPVSSLPLLSKIQQGGVDVLKGLKKRCEKGSFSRDCVLMIDKMDLQKSVQYQS